MDMVGVLRFSKITPSLVRTGMILVSKGTLDLRMEDQDGKSTAEFAR